MFKEVILIPVFSIALLTPSTAIARTKLPEVTNAIEGEHVRIGDLDLHDPAGWHIANARLGRATARVCAAEIGLLAAVRCRSESMARAKRELQQRFETGASRAGEAVAGR